jgi:hypothetical protein
VVSEEKIKTLKVVIGNDCTGSCKSNYYMLKVKGLESQEEKYFANNSFFTMSTSF